MKSGESIGKIIGSGLFVTQVILIILQLLGLVSLHWYQIFMPSIIYLGLMSVLLILIGINELVNGGKK